MEITAQNFYEALEKLVCQNLKPWKLTYFSLGENIMSLWFFWQENLKIKILIYDLCLEVDERGKVQITIAEKIEHISKK